MNIRLHPWVKLIVRLFKLSLQFYPHMLRQNYAAEMQAVFRFKAEEAALKGSRSLFTLAYCEARDLPIAIISEYYHAMRGHMKIIFPFTSDQTPWQAALLSLLPFLIAGPLRIIISYQPGWRSADSSFNYFWFLLFSFLLVLAGFGIGILKNSRAGLIPILFSWHSASISLLFTQISSSNGTSDWSTIFSYISC